MPKPSFSSVTTWQNDVWFIDIFMSGFSTAQKAADFGSNGLKSLIREGDTLVLVRCDGELLPVPADQVKVYRLKPEAVSKLVTTCDDRDLVAITPREFAKIPGLSGTFGSLSYGVRDPQGGVVRL